jgi:hypothetical protein
MELLSSIAEIIRNFLIFVAVMTDSVACRPHLGCFEHTRQQPAQTPPRGADVPRWSHAAAAPS